jgi:(2S)-methylsuccinyl-CoA dehydrogenase
MRHSHTDRQRELHALAWITTTAEAVLAAARWGLRLAQEGRLAPVESLVLQIGIGEYLAQLASGIAMSQSEVVRPAELGLGQAASALQGDETIAWFVAGGNTAANRRALVTAIRDGITVDESLVDSDLAMVREQFRRFADERVAPKAHQWHLDDVLIPDEIVNEMAALGTFGVCIAPEYGGLGMGKLAMCVVTEELSRAWIAAGSLGTRSEIAGELISLAGTPEQKARWLPDIASPARCCPPPCSPSPTPAPTSALAAHARQPHRYRLAHRRQQDLDHARVAQRPDDADGAHRREGVCGLSMFLAPKSRGNDTQPFPADGMSGSEIPVLGYRGMKEYEIAFDGFAVPADGLLGGVQGQGFKQLMQTFEGARVQTAARAVGVAWKAYDLGLRYARTAGSSASPSVEFPRVADKLALMLAETVLARELTYFAATEKDKGHRCDIEAGMAKLLAARVAWSNAGPGLQIHGGNGYALELRDQPRAVRRAHPEHLRGRGRDPGAGGRLWCGSTRRDTLLASGLSACSSCSAARWGRVAFVGARRNVP